MVFPVIGDIGVRGVGRVSAVRGGSRVGVVRDGIVVDRPLNGDARGEDTFVRVEKPALWSKAD